MHSNPWDSLQWLFWFSNLADVVGPEHLAEWRTAERTGFWDVT